MEMALPLAAPRLQVQPRSSHVSWSGVPGQHCSSSSSARPKTQPHALASTTIAEHSKTFVGGALCSIFAVGALLHSRRVSNSRRQAFVASRRSAVAVAAKKSKSGDFRYTSFRGSGYANWVSDQVLLGRYPYLEPSRPLSREDGDARLAEILNAGVDLFVSLMEEVPPQEELGDATTGGGFTGYYSAVTEIAAGEHPKHKMTPREVRFLRYPIVDLSTPSMGGLKGLVDRLEEEVKAGHKLYIHCWGGRGRAVVVGACLIGKLEGLSSAQALERVQAQYTAREQDNYRSPETAPQRALVKRFLDEAKKA